MGTASDGFENIHLNIDGLSIDACLPSGFPRIQRTQIRVRVRVRVRSCFNRPLAIVKYCTHSTAPVCVTFSILDHVLRSEGCITYRNHFSYHVHNRLAKRLGKHRGLGGSRFQFLAQVRTRDGRVGSGGVGSPVFGSNRLATLTFTGNF